MAYSSNTKSWQACNSSQQRECKAHAVFAFLKGQLPDLNSSIRKLKSELLSKIEKLKDKNKDGVVLDEKETKLFLAAAIVENIDVTADGVVVLEGLSNKIESEINIGGIPVLSGAELKSLLKAGSLSKILKAADRFTWSGSSTSLPKGKSDSDIGVGDSILDQFMAKSSISGLLSSWLESGDRGWKSLIDPEIERRKKDLSNEKAKSSRDNDKIRRLEFEIQKLERDWIL